MNRRALVIQGVAIVIAGTALASEAAEVTTQALPSSALPLVAISPCRIVDTRSATFPPGYGTPALGAGVARVFTFTGQCGIPATGAIANTVPRNTPTLCAGTPSSRVTTGAYTAAALPTTALNACAPSTTATTCHNRGTLRVRPSPASAPRA